MAGAPALPSARKQRDQPPHVAIEPLQVPWLQHEQFSAVKAATSAPDGLVTSKRSAVAKVGQELKRARTYVDQQLAQLEKQLMVISNFLEGSSASVFPPHILVEARAAPAAAVQATAASAGGGAESGQGVGVRGQVLDEPTASALQSAAFLVEDDLASDSPCTTKGLWQYLDAYSYFKPVVPEDMEAALSLEDESLVFDDDTLDMETTEGFDATSESHRPSFSPSDKPTALADFNKRFPDASKESRQELDDFLKERLLAALLPLPSCSATSHTTASIAEAVQNGDSGSTSPCKDADEMRAKEPKDHRVRRREQDEAAYAASWDASRITSVLREVGLLEMSEAGVASCMKNPSDDPVAQEIRALQAELRATIRGTNAAKRVLRQMLDKKKPWLSQQESIDRDNVAKYSALLRRKKELERKKKLKEKKRMRRDALRASIESSQPR